MPRACAHRPLPSMMMPRWCGTAVISAARSTLLRVESAWVLTGKGLLQQRRPAAGYRCMVQSFTGAPQTEAKYGCSAISDRHNFGVFFLDDLVDELDMLVRELLDLLLGALLVILGDQAFLLKIGKILVGVAANVAHSHARLFAALVNDLGQLAAPLLVEMRNDQTNRLPIVRRRQPEI